MIYVWCCFPRVFTFLSTLKWIISCWYFKASVTLYTQVFHHYWEFIHTAVSVYVRHFDPLLASKYHWLSHFAHFHLMDMRDCYLVSRTYRFCRVKNEAHSQMLFSAFCFLSSSVCKFDNIFNWKRYEQTVIPRAQFPVSTEYHS